VTSNGNGKSIKSLPFTTPIATAPTSPSPSRWLALLDYGYGFKEYIGPLTHEQAIDFQELVLAGNVAERCELLPLESAHHCRCRLQLGRLPEA
jgi:hypothetical protein